MEALILIILIGLCWGSFLNVVIHRLPHDQNLMRPPSSCPGCGSRIKPYDNIPLLSYIILRGRCRNCGFSIPLSYPLVELITPAAFIVLYFSWGLSWHFLAGCLFTSGLIALAVIDFYHQILPDEITLPGLALGLGYSLIRPDMTLRQALIGALSGALFLLLVYGTYYLLRKKEGLGMGDVTLMLYIGAFLGWKLSLFTLITASFAGTVVGIILIIGQKKDLRFALPFGTFLAPAAYFALLLGDPIISWYFGFFRL